MGVHYMYTPIVKQQTLKKNPLSLGLDKLKLTVACERAR